MAPPEENENRRPHRSCISTEKDAATHEVSGARENSLSDAKNCRVATFSEVAVPHSPLAPTGFTAPVRTVFRAMDACSGCADPILLFQTAVAPHGSQKNDPPNAAARVRVLLVEDHPMVRRGMRALLASTGDFLLCAEAETPEDALEALVGERPDVVCLDLILGKADGLGLIRAMVEASPNVRILVVSVREEQAYAERCLDAGALGYAMKTEPNEALLAALRRVAEGKVHLSPRVAMHVLNDLPNPRPARKGVGGLTERELQVFRLIGLGWSTRRISERLGIGIKTVETHRENIKNKLRIEHSTALVREATRWVRETT